MACDTTGANSEAPEAAADSGRAAAARAPPRYANTVKRSVNDAFFGAAATTEIGEGLAATAALATLGAPVGPGRCAAGHPAGTTRGTLRDHPDRARLPPDLHEPLAGRHERQRQHHPQHRQQN